jgi:hypothetical protein
MQQNSCGTLAKSEVGFYSGRVALEEIANLVRAPLVNFALIANG